MPRIAHALEALVACLRGEPPARLDWFSLIHTANRSWLTPALHLVVARRFRPDDAPEDVRQYLAFVHHANAQRNLRLRAQLLEAVSALNSVAIEPTLLRGAAFLYTARDDEIGMRMMSDLDVMVEEAELQPAHRLLLELGYESFPFRAFGRPQDVGVLELYRPPQRICSYLTRSELDMHVGVALRAGLSAKLPSPTFQVLHLILSDQLQEGDYWTGCIDLRHLYDLSRLLGSSGEIDWRLLRSILADRVARNAFATQLLTLHHVFGTELPPDLFAGHIPRLQHWRRMFQVRHPVAGAPMRAAGLAALGLRRVRTGDAPEWFKQQGPVRQARATGRELLKAVRGIYKHPRL